MKLLTVTHGDEGGADHLLVPDYVDANYIAAAKREYDQWYKEKYLPQYRKASEAPLPLNKDTRYPVYIDFPEWLIAKHDARQAIENVDYLTLDI